MKILCIGGGPAGLYFALLMKKQNPGHQITVIERHRSHDTFGWGIVFPDQTFEDLRTADEASAQMIMGGLLHWNQLHIEFKGHRLTSGGHGFCAIGRKRLLNILKDRCEDMGVRLVFEIDAADDQALAMQYQADLVIASDGMSSRIRGRYADSYMPRLEKRKCRFVWLGTRKRFDGFTYSFEETEHGWFQSHAYCFDQEFSNFVVEVPEEVWLLAGLDHMSQIETLDFCEKLFYRQLDGQRLLFSSPHLRGSGIWSNFLRINCEKWVHWNDLNGKAVPVVLLGDAAHTSHYSLGVGTKLALEDAICLAHCLREGLPAAGQGLRQDLEHFQETRIAQVRQMQWVVGNSMDWFENVHRYTAMDAPQFAYSLISRSQRLSHENLRLRDPLYVAKHEHWFAERAFKDANLAIPATIPKPCMTPLKLRGTVLQNRMVSRLALPLARDGLIEDGQTPLESGEAALLVTDRVCVSAAARLAPDSPGMYAPLHTQAWRRVVAVVHQKPGVLIAARLAHTGIAITVDSATQADLNQILADFVCATQAADEAGFDWLELDCAQGCLLSGFLSPHTNFRDDQYGVSLENRCRYPLQAVTAMRAVWPGHKPLSVRISIGDWGDPETGMADLVFVAKLFRQAGVDMITCAGDQRQNQPAPDRMVQTLFSDRVRNEAGIPTLVAGAIDAPDQMNGIIAAGRADLCALGW